MEKEYDCYFALDSKAGKENISYSVHILWISFLWQFVISYVFVSDLTDKIYNERERERDMTELRPFHCSINFPSVFKKIEIKLLHNFSTYVLKHLPTVNESYKPHFNINPDISRLWSSLVIEILKEWHNKLH